jgi:hypothetical protein
MKTMLYHHDEVEANCDNCIAAVWCDEGIRAINGDRYIWRYKTLLPHATFEIVEHGYLGGMSYCCKGMVISVKDLR